MSGAGASLMSRTYERLHPPPGTRARLRLRSIGRSHLGCVRTLNEDRYLDRGDLGLWAVADGMGGHEAGDLAATRVVEALASLPRPTTGAAFLNDVCGQLQTINRELLDRASALPQGALIGSTVAALLAFDDHYACVWAGDSRIYLLRDNRLQQLTHDHSVVQEMVDRGELTAEAARGHARSNIVTRAVGVNLPLILDVNHAAMRPGDLYLICSDGLTAMLTDEEIRRVLHDAPLDEAADDLLDLSLQRGARDNVTFILLGVGVS